MLNTEVNSALKEALENIVYMYLDDEQKHYEEESNDNHIYKSLKVVQNYLDKSE